MSFKGRYRGAIKFRSLLELSVIRHLEQQGLVLGSTMLYETVRIPYGRNNRRQYIVDLELPEIMTLIEVKPESRIGNRNNKMKRLAAEAWCRENGWTYVIITDEILRSAGGTLLSLEDAANIDVVELDGRAKRILKNRETRRKRIKRRSVKPVARQDRGA